MFVIVVYQLFMISFFIKTTLKILVLWHEFAKKDFGIRRYFGKKDFGIRQYFGKKDFGIRRYFGKINFGIRLFYVILWAKRK